MDRTASPRDPTINTMSNPVRRNGRNSTKEIQSMNVMEVSGALYFGNSGLDKFENITKNLQLSFFPVGLPEPSSAVISTMKQQGNRAVGICSIW